MKRGARRVLGVGLATLTSVLTVMWLSSYHFYTSLGIDSDMPDGSLVRATYLRVRWPGDGSFRMGGAATLPQPLVSYAVEPFDLGGTFFQPPRTTAPRSVWNRLGFWWIDSPSAEGEDLNDWVFWVGIPSWIPPLLTGVLAVFVIRRSRRSPPGQDRSLA